MSYTQSMPLYYQFVISSQIAGQSTTGSNAQKGTIRSAFRNAVLSPGTERERFTFIPGLESKGTEWSLGPFLLRSNEADRIPHS